MNIPICTLSGDNQILTTGAVTYNHKKIASSVDIFNILSLLHHNAESSEIVYLIPISDLLVPVAIFIVGAGSQSAASFDFNKLFRILLLTNSKAYYVAHNHPSQNYIPSKNDINITRILLDLSSILQIKLIDHLIITNDNFYEICRNCKLV